MVCQQRPQEAAGIRRAKLATEQFDGVEHCRFAYETDWFPWLRVGRVPSRHVGRTELASWRASAQRFQLCGRCHQCSPSGTSRHFPEMKSLAFLAARDDVSGTPHPRYINFSAYYFLRSLCSGSRLISAIAEAWGKCRWMCVLDISGSHSWESQSWVLNCNSF